MSFITAIKKYRNIITIALSLIGIALMMYYDYCDTACRYLKGDIWGIDLKWIGIAYMLAIIIFTVLGLSPFVKAMLAGGLGVEAHLYAFQIQNDVYCPFCLAFSAMLILSFIINYDVSSAWFENRRRMWLYFLGEVDFPMFRIRKVPLLIFSLFGYLTILFTLSGSVTPAYGQEIAPGVPSLGKGSYEIVLFADYFCPPCLRIDTKAEPLLKELLATGKVKITFADVPFHTYTPIYAKYYLYAANANSEANNILHVRKILFEAAQVKNIHTESDLVAYLNGQKILWKPLDEKSIFQTLSVMINNNNIKSTPTCVIKYSASDVKRFVGDVEIWNGLNALKTHISAERK
ncbi:MAG TPA: thioredoxin domain-containing protein [Smithella sp.]|nr:thioredoxin domain-containing protein [Smithella sp.]